jgi:hypothetical protein
VSSGTGRIEVPGRTEKGVAREASGIGVELVTDAITGELRALAGPELYRRNAFRISGLPAAVDRRTTRQVVQRLRAALQVGADVDLGPNASSDPAEIQTACDLILGDPRRRLVHEVFAPWGDDVSKCGCPPTIHQRHDAAVEAHATAIEAELTNAMNVSYSARDDHWTSAGRAWDKLLESTEFWGHLDHRVHELDDRQLDRSALDLIDDELPRTLLKPITDLTMTTKTKPDRLAHRARHWPAPAALIDQQLEAAANPLYTELEDRRVALTRRFREENADTIAAEIERDVVPTLRKLDALVPPDRHHRTATLHDQFALLLNNCAVQLLDLGQVTDGRAEKWLGTAAKLATDPRTKDLIEQNREVLQAGADSMREFEEQILLILRLRGKAAAISVLRQVRRENTEPSVRAEIDRMLREVSNGTLGKRRVPVPVGGPPPRQPTHYTPDPTNYYRPRRRWGWILVWILVIAAIAYGVARSGAIGGTTMSMFSTRIADNAKPGTCLEKQSDWRAEAKALRVQDCDSPHWAEVLAYVRITAVPGAYPGEDQAGALAEFQCGEALGQQGLSSTEYVSEALVASGDHWNTGKDANTYENYASCIVHRKDGQDITAGQKVKDNVPAKPAVVSMNLFSTGKWSNAPVGLCIKEKASIGTGVTGLVPVVRCTEKHWAQVFGYPEIFKPGEKWPGDDAVYAKAKKACSKVVPSLPGYATAVGWPDREWWNDPKRAIFTYCLVHRANDETFEGRLG